MAWTSLTYAFNSILTSAKMTQNQDNFTAVAQGLSGAPKILRDALDVTAKVAYTEIIRKTADETVVSSTTLQNDDDLKITVAAFEVWAFRLFIGYNAGAIGGGDGIKFKWSVPSGTTMKWQDGSTSEIIVFTEATVFNAGSEQDDRSFCHYGQIAVGSTGGTVNLQWAQQASNTYTATVQINSYLIAHRLT